jgi:PRC-barrel domain
MEAMMQTETTSRETRSLIASDRVEGTPVRCTDGTTLGTIERVMIDKLTGNIAYAVLRFEGPGRVEQKDLSVPWPRLVYDRKLGAYRLDLINGELGEAPPDASDKDFDRDGRACYWGIAETW